jgi:hypothetical protein
MTVDHCTYFFHDIKKMVLCNALPYSAWKFSMEYSIDPETRRPHDGSVPKISRMINRRTKI